ncbi:MAG: hypothetical protein NDI61_11095 [Bdellovibrionaceae bacterium]|nr:hypothetical protein [Pseudobdellovibrionaceae bacterium]
MSENTNELPAVARNINLACKKCGVDRYFVVVAHTTATSAKVKCEVCGAQKTYKLPTEKKAKSSTGAKGGARKAATKKPDHSALWNELKTQIGTENLVSYNMKTKYPMAAVIEHPKFGIGFVTNSFHDKIEVAFLEGGRYLVHNRG